MALHFLGIAIEQLMNLHFELNIDPRQIRCESNDFEALMVHPYLNTKLGHDHYF